MIIRSGNAVDSALEFCTSFSATSRRLADWGAVQVSSALFCSVIVFFSFGESGDLKARGLIELFLDQVARSSSSDTSDSNWMPDSDALFFHVVAMIDAFLNQVSRQDEARALEFCGPFLTRVW